MALGKINFNLVAEAIKFYEYLGYEYIDVPWQVHPTVISMTTVDSPREYNNGLIGSGEQGLLQLYMRNFLSQDKYYITATPCFRPNDEGDYSKPEFFKVELFIGSKYSEIYYQNLMLDAMACFYEICGIKVLNKKISESSEDLFYKNIELGSYGYRDFNRFKWAYGTGLAEPRTSTVLRENIADIKSFNI
jgi:hypothetical protein